MSKPIKVLETPKHMKQLNNKAIARNALAHFHDVKERHQFIMQKEIDKATDSIIETHTKIIDAAWNDYLKARGTQSTVKNKW